VLMGDGHPSSVLNISIQRVFVSEIPGQNDR
jgi:hypothetical protein